MENDIKLVAASLSKKAEKLLKRRSTGKTSPLQAVETLSLIHELEVLQIELEMQNDELERKKVELKAGKDVSDVAAQRYSNLFDFSPSAYITLNREGEIMDLNLTAAKQLGKEKVHLFKSRFGFFVTEETRLAFNTFLEEVFTTRLKATCEVTLATRDNTPLYAFLTGVYSENDDQCLISATDITERKQTEIYKEIRREILQILNEPAETKEIIHRSIELLKTITDLDAVGIRLQDGDDYPFFDQIGFPCEFVLSENSLAKKDKKGNVFRDDKGNVCLSCLCGRVISGKNEVTHPYNTPGGSWWTDHLSEIPASDFPSDKKFQHRNQCNYHGYASLALIPIMNNSTIMGLIQFNDSRRNRFNRNIIEVLEGIASHIGAALMRKKAEEELRKNEELLRSITGNAPDIIIKLDHQGNILYMNRAFPGYDLDDCLGKSYLEWCLAIYHAEMNKSLALVFEESTTQVCLSQMRHGDGEIRWYRSGISPVKEGDRVEHAILITRDITEFLLQEEILKESEEKRNAILVTAMDGFWITNSEGRFLEVNDIYCNMSGYSKQELLSLHIHDIETIENVDNTSSHIQNIITFGKDRFETYHRRKDGSIMEVESNVHYRPIEGGQFVSFIHDITDRKQSEKELRESEERYKSFFQDNQSVMLLLDPDTGKIIDANPIACNYYGWSYSELCHKNLFEIDISPKELIMEVLNESKNKKSNHLFRKHRLANGEIREVEIFAGPLKFGNSITRYTIIHDITESKKAENELRESEERYKSLFQENQSVMLLVNPDTGDIIDANPVACNYYGWPYSELCHKSLFEIDPEPKEETLQKLKESKNERNNHLFIKHRLANGELRDIEVFSGPIKFGDTIMLYTIIHDITESKKAQEALRINEERYSLIYNSSRDGIFSIDLQGNFTAMNRSFCKEVNLEFSQIISRKFNELGLSEHLTSELEQLKDQVLETRNSVLSELKVSYYDLSIRYYEIVLNPLSNGNGHIVGISGSIRNITKRKAADQALKESEMRFRTLIKDVPVGMVLYGPKAEVILSNPKALELLGVTQESELGIDFQDYNGWIAIHEDRSEFQLSELPIKQVFETQNSVHDVVIGIKKAGSNSTTWLLMDAEILLTDDGATRNVICSFIDIAKLKKTEDELRENEQRLKYHFENSPLAVVEWDNKMIITEWSLEAEHIFGWKKEEAIGSPIDSLNLIYNEDIPFLYHTMDRLTSGKEDTVVSYNRNLTKSGAIIDCTWYNSILLDKNGQIASVMSLVQDITIRKQAEDALRKLNEELEDRVQERTVELIKLNEGLKLTEEKYRTVSDFAANWEFWIDPVDHMIYCSPSCESITGYKSTEFEQNSELIFDIIHPDDLMLFQEHKKNEIQAKISEHELQYRIIKRDGTVRWIGHYCRPVFDETGDFKGIRGSNKDITTRKKMEELLTTSNQKYKLLSENITDGIFICKKGRFEYVNKAIYDIFGYQGRELERMKLTQLVASDYNEKLEKILYSTEKVDRSCNIEVECLKKDLTIIYVEILLNYVAADKTVYGVMHDITEKKEFQKNIVRAIIQTEERERTNFSKELHDGLGPLLSTIKLYLQCSERLRSNKSRKEIIGKAGEIIEESLSTVKEISYRLSPHLLTNYGLNSAIRNFVEKLNATGSYNIVFESNFNRRIDVEIETAFYRAVIECINNTLKYAQATKIFIQLTDSGSHVQLEYKDDGIGFDLTETFEKHKGLGLFNLQNRLQTFGGKVNLQSEPGKGVDYLFSVNI